MTGHVRYTVLNDILIASIQTDATLDALLTLAGYA